MRPTTIFEKLLTSVINSLVAILLVAPFLKLAENSISEKLMIISSFFILKLAAMIFNQNRNLGMVIIGSYWNKPTTIFNQIKYNLLYTISFASLFFWIVFPFDLALLNLLFIQAITVKITRTTMHAYLSDYLITCKKMGYSI